MTEPRCTCYISTHRKSVGVDGQPIGTICTTCGGFEPWRTEPKADAGKRQTEDNARNVSTRYP